ncbi:MAG: LicD family protein [Treponema sp.]|nr:LicD family protein [Treponema sp.]
MAYINTNDYYVKEYCKKHKDVNTAFDELDELKRLHLGQYGVSVKGGIEDVLYDVNKKTWFKNLKEVQIDLLKELKRICDKNGINLYLIYGSLLGAVRSGGMLSGDDDIDVALMREDYDKLLSLAAEFKSPYFLQNNYNDDCFYGGYIKFRNSQATAINPQNWYVSCNEGIFIDIFPIDKSNGSAIKEFLKLKKIHFLQRLLYAKSYGFFSSFKDMPLFVWKFYKCFGKLFKRDSLLNKLDSAFKSNDGKGNKLAIYTHYGKSASARYMKSSLFEKSITMTYEGMDFLAPAGWDQVLYGFYGENYLIPSNLKNEFHAFYKADVPYSYYKKRFTSLFTSQPDKNKELMFVGEKELFLEYQKRFPHSSYKPKDFIDSEKLELLKDYSFDAVHIVIGAFDFLSVEKLIRDYGFRDYSIYIYNRDGLLLPNIKSSKNKYKIEKERNF